MSYGEYVEYTKESKILAIVPKIPALLSILGSSYIIYNVLVVQRKKSDQRNRHYHQLMLALSISDILASHIYFLGTFLIPRGSTGPFGPVYWAFGTDHTCSYSGFFNQFAVASPLYNSMLSIYFLLKIRYGWKAIQLNKIAPFLHGFPVVFALGTAFFALLRRPDTLYGNVFWTCWINPDPPQPDFQWFQWAFLFAPVWACVIFQTVAMVFLYLSVRKVAKESKEIVKSQEFSLRAREDSIETTNNDMTYTTVERIGSNSKQNSTNETHESSDEEEIESDIEQPSPLDSEAVLASRAKMRQHSRTIAIQGILYVGAFYITWIFPTIQRILELADVPGKFWLQALDTSLLPLQGVFNVFIYLRPKYVFFRQKYPDLPCSLILRMVHNGADEEKLAENYALRLEEKLIRLRQIINQSQGSCSANAQRLTKDNRPVRSTSEKPGEKCTCSQNYRCIIAATSPQTDISAVCPVYRRMWKNGTIESPPTAIPYFRTSGQTSSSGEDSAYCDEPLPPIARRLRGRRGLVSMSSVTKSLDDFDERSTFENNKWGEGAESPSRGMVLSPSVAKRLNNIMSGSSSGTISDDFDIRYSELVSEASQMDSRGSVSENLALPPIPRINRTVSLSVIDTDLNRESKSDNLEQRGNSQDSIALPPVARRLDIKLLMDSLSSTTTVSKTDFEDKQCVQEQSKRQRERGSCESNHLFPVTKNGKSVTDYYEPIKLYNSDGDKRKAGCSSETPCVTNHTSNSVSSRFLRVSHLGMISEVTLDSELERSDRCSCASSAVDCLVERYSTASSTVDGLAESERSLFTPSTHHSSHSANSAPEMPKRQDKKLELSDKKAPVSSAVDCLVASRRSLYMPSANRSSSSAYSAPKISRRSDQKLESSDKETHFVSAAEYLAESKLSLFVPSRNFSSHSAVSAPEIPRRRVHFKEEGEEEQPQKEALPRRWSAIDLAPICKQKDSNSPSGDDHPLTNFHEGNKNPAKTRYISVDSPMLIPKRQLSPKPGANRNCVH